MTTIACRDGVMAADTLITHDEYRTCQVLKLAVNKYGDVAGAAGHSWRAAEFLGRFREADDPLALEFGFADNAGALIVLKSGEVYAHDGGTPFRIYGDYHAIGSGLPVAMAAMDMGANAIDAVRVACGRDPFSGLPLYAASVGNQEIRLIDCAPWTAAPPQVPR